MSDARGRVLDYALWRLHHEAPDAESSETTARDLATRVRRAWERGAPGPDLADLPELPPPAATAPPADPRDRARAAQPRRFASRRRAAAWGTALLAASVALAFLLRRAAPPAGVPVGVAVAGPVARWRADAGGPARWDVGPLGGGLLEAGEHAFATGAVDVALAGGARAHLWPASLFRVEPGGTASPPRMTLEWGRATLATPAGGALELVLAQTTVRLGPESELAVDLAWDRPAPAPDALHLIEPTRARLARGAVGRLELVLAHGTAAVSLDGTRDGNAAALEPGLPLRIALETRGPRVLDPERLAALARDLDVATGAVEVEPPAGEMAFWGVLEAVDATPALAVEVAELARARLARPDLSAASRRAWIALLALTPGEAAARVARERFAVAPGDFDTEVLVALAERGVEPFPAEARAVVEHDDPDARAPWIPRADRLDPLPAALFLAMRGDDLGRALLDAECPDPARVLREEQTARTLAAAAGLERLGDATAWRACTRALAREIDRLLDGSPARRNRAARLALTWQAVDRSLRGPDPPRAGLLESRVRGFVFPRLAGYADAKALRALVAELSAR